MEQTQMNAEEQKTNTLKRTIKRGTCFRASSYKQPNKLWKVSRRVKTDKQNLVWTCCPETGQTRKYTGSQFGIGLRMGWLVLESQYQKRLSDAI